MSLKFLGMHSINFKYAGGDSNVVARTARGGIYPHPSLLGLVPIYPGGEIALKFTTLHCDFWNLKVTSERKAVLLLCFEIGQFNWFRRPNKVCENEICLGFRIFVIYLLFLCLAIQLHIYVLQSRNDFHAYIKTFIGWNS